MCARQADADLAFECSEAESPDIFRIDERVGKASLLNLTDHPADDTMPAWSPDGARIAFVSSRDDGAGDIFVMDSDGGDAESLTGHGAWDGHPSWSPDGGRITFQSDRAGSFDIFAMESSGRDVRQLTEHPATDTDPAWSPDGEWVAFSSHRDGHYNIFMVNADGRELRRVTDHAFGYAIKPTWSPDGRRVAFSSNVEGNGIYVMTMGGEDAQRVTGRGGHVDPAWSPDGSSIAYALSVNAGDLRIMARNVDTWQATKVTDGPGSDLHPSWMPAALGVEGVSNRHTLMWGWLKQLGAGGHNQ